MTNEELRKHLEAIQSIDTLSPLKVVEVAASPNHPLHERFEWDNKVAGHEWRVHQARQLIGQARMTITIHNVEVEVPVYVPSAPSDGYKRLDSFTNDSPGARRAVLLAAKTSLGHLARVKYLSGALLGLEASYTRTVRKIETLVKELEALDPTQGD
jgi:hypothetical protein